jgi:hypothetical protein
MLSDVEPGTSNSDTGVDIIQSPAEFSRAATTLLIQTQKLNELVGMTFTADSQAVNASDSGIANALRSIPLSSAREIAAFSFRLENSVSLKQQRTMTQNHDHDTSK